MNLAPPCCAGRAANCMPTGPLPTDDLSQLCALPLTTAPHPTPLVTLTRVVLPFALGCTSCHQPAPPMRLSHWTWQGPVPRPRLSATC